MRILQTTVVILSAVLGAAGLAHTSPQWYDWGRPPFDDDTVAPLVPGDRSAQVDRRAA